MNKVYTAEILGVGTELLLGNILNSDARDISVMLSELGINVYWHSVVGDNPARLTEVVEIAKKRADIIITTGGLGPTCDDLTKQVLAKAFGLELEFNQEAADRMREHFTVLGKEMTDNNLQQAYLPEGCTVFQNYWGTAPGCAFKAEGCIVLMLPGPPRECNAMFRHWAMPYLSALSDETIVSHNIRIFGMGESSVEYALRDLMNELSNPTLAPYAKEGECMLRVTAKAHSEEEAEKMMVPVIAKVREVLGSVIYGIDANSLEETAFGLMKEQGITLAVAESCTGGLLSKRITDMPGASQVFLGGFIVYSNMSKSKLLGIDPKLIEDKGAVSEPVAREMASRAREKLGTDIGIGITGVAGPETDGRNDVGVVYIALATKNEVYCRRFTLGKTRERVRLAAANNAFDMIRRHLTGLPMDA
ncbi:MAG: competence/damage-inducible protein A [Oscillospiraceae bacterium]